MRNLIRAGFIALISGLSLLFIVFATAQNNQDIKKNEEVFQHLKLFADILARVQTDSVNVPDNKVLIESAINGMLGKLDAHSSYLNPEQFKELQNNTKGEYTGVGIEVVFKNNIIQIVSPIEGGPAEKAGLKPGDKIIGINGESIIGQPFDPSVKKIRGKPGTNVVLTIVRKDVEEPFLVKLERAVIDKYSVYTKILENGYPLVRIVRFNEKTTSDLKKAIHTLKDNPKVNFTGLILDLRKNPGGLLQEAIGVSDVFLKKGQIVSIKGRNVGSEERFNGRTEDVLKGMPVVVLIDGGSASASEIVAGALQDRGRAIIVGETSFGKGSVQTVIPLRGGRDGALRLTTSLYYTPSGDSIQGVGIEPDILISNTYKKPKKGLEHIYNKEANLPNAIKNKKQTDSDNESEKKMEYPPKDWLEAQDYQLKRAVDILKEKIRKG